jgi:hypothetical protein
MTWWDFALWGFFGGFIVDGLELWHRVQKNNGKWPSGYLSIAFFIAEIIRLVAGAGLAVAFGKSGQVNGSIGALAIGVATPLIVEKLSSFLPSLPQKSGVKS